MAHSSSDREYVLKVLAERKKARHAELEEDEAKGKAHAQALFNSAKSLKESKERDREMATYGKNDYTILSSIDETLKDTVRDREDHRKQPTPDYVISLLSKVAHYLAGKLEAMKDTTHTELVKIVSHYKQLYDESAGSVYVDNVAPLEAIEAAKRKCEAAERAKKAAIDKAKTAATKLATAAKAAEDAQHDFEAGLEKLEGMRASVITSPEKTRPGKITKVNFTAAEVENLRKEAERLDAEYEAAIKRADDEEAKVLIEGDNVALEKAKVLEAEEKRKTQPEMIYRPLGIAAASSAAVDSAAVGATVKAAELAKGSAKLTELKKIADSKAAYQQLLTGVKKRELIM